jgi:ADP-dependent NAD(P)H-hydrate dehydratase
MTDHQPDRNVIQIDDDTLRAWPLPMASGGDKEDRGRVLLAAGSSEIPGAAVLAATAALRAGAGKVTIATPASLASQMAFAVPEARVIALEQTRDGVIAPSAIDALEEFAGKTRALLVGPGLAYGEATNAFTLALLEMFGDVATIVDAAAMDVVMKSGAGISRFATPPILTPHAGEMAKLTGRAKEEIEADCARTAMQAAKEWNAVVALKGAITHIASPDGRVWRHDRGNFGLATSGSGDVLAGIMAGLVARGAALEQAAAWGVALHARAGERLGQNLGTLGYLAREIAAEVPSIMASFAASFGPELISHRK